MPWPRYEAAEFDAAGLGGCEGGASARIDLAALLLGDGYPKVQFEGARHGHLGTPEIHTALHELYERYKVRWRRVRQPTNVF